MLVAMQQYIGLLEERQRAAATAQQAGQPPPQEPPAPPPRCNLCGRAAGEGAALQRMQLVGQRQHVAVCGACSVARLGSLIPLTPLWQMDEASRAVVLEGLACAARGLGFWPGTR